MPLARAFTYGLLVFLGTAGLGFVALPELARAAGLFALDADARGAFSLVTLKAAPLLAGGSAAASLSYEWLAAFSLTRRIAAYCATTLLVWLAAAVVAVFVLG